MKTFYTFLLFAIPFLFIKCSDDSISETYDYSFENEFKINTEYHSFKRSLIFSITEINDSRCPSDVICVWQGMVTLRIEVASPVTETLLLNTNDNLLDSVKGYAFQLLNVSPNPISTENIKPEEYRVRLKITKLDN
jgi:hypothetical protein